MRVDLIIQNIPQEILVLDGNGMLHGFACLNDGLQLCSTFLRDGSLIVCPGSPVQIGIQHGSHGRGILFIVELPLILQTVGIHTITDQIAQDTVTAAAEVCQKIEIISKFLREILPQESFPVLLRHQMPVVFPDGAVQFRYLFLRKRREQSIQNIRIVIIFLVPGKQNLGDIALPG